MKIEKKLSFSESINGSFFFKNLIYSVSATSVVYFISNFLFNISSDVSSNEKVLIDSTAAMVEAPAYVPEYLDNPSDTLFYEYNNLSAIQTKGIPVEQLSVLQKGIISNIPFSNNYVYDYVKSFSISEVDSLESISKIYFDNFGFNIGVITLFPFMYNNIDTFNINVANRWSKSNPHEAGVDVLFTFCPLNRELKVSNNDWVSKLVSDQETEGLINDYMLPFFRQNDYFGGLRNGMVSFGNLLGERRRISILSAQNEESTD
jgi:hypothetical protein